IASGEVVSEREVKGVKTRQTSEGGFSQARYQRHIGNFHLHHAKEVIDTLDRIVREEGITQILLAGDEVISPLLREQMPKHLADSVVDRLRVPVRSTVSEIIDASLAAMRRLNERTDREKVEEAIGAYRAGGLGVAGPDATLDALIKGQVDELLLTASMRTLRPAASSTANDSALAEPAVETAA